MRTEPEQWSVVIRATVTSSNLGLPQARVVGMCPLACSGVAHFTLRLALSTLLNPVGGLGVAVRILLLLFHL